MAKARTVYVCQSCGAQSPKWMGRCPSCGEWNSYVEERIAKSASKTGRKPKETVKAIRIDEVEERESERIIFKDAELNRVLGGGLVYGSVVLLGGDPGIGKSTLLLQTAVHHPEMRIVYVAGEESEYQIKMRAERLGLKKSSTFLLVETTIDDLLPHLEEINPDMVVIDSIQTLHSDQLDSAPGSVSQIRECASGLIGFAKGYHIPVILIGHITKEGSLAGPKVLEHMVDTVLQFEGDRNHVYRILRASKNRFGSTNELGIYEMQGGGLRGVDNPSEILLSPRDQDLSGIGVAVVMEGMRPVLIEAQALVGTAVYGTPQRSTTGFDAKRLNMLLAVLEKRCGFRLGSKDVFLNITGGLKIDDPAADLAVASAVLSSNEDIAVDERTCFAAEVGLSGELRPVTRADQRIREAAKLGFERIMVSNYNKGLQENYKGIEVIKLNKIEQVFARLFG